MEIVAGGYRPRRPGAARDRAGLRPAAVHDPDGSRFSRALAFAKGDLNPHNFLYPTFFFYVLFAWIGGAFVLARGPDRSPHSVPFSNASSWTPRASTWPGVRSARSAAHSARLSRRSCRTLFDRPTGLAAAALLAVAPVAVMDAHYVKHDVPATLAIVVGAVATCLRWPEGGATGACRRATSALPLSPAASRGRPTTARYSSCAAGRDCGRRAPARGVARRRPALVAAGAAAAVTSSRCRRFCLSSTGDGVARHRRQPSDRRGSRHRSRLVANLFRYAELLVGIGATLPVAAASAIGTVLLIATDRRRAVFLLSFPVPFLLFIGNTVPASRYLNPVLPIVALTAAVAFRRLPCCWPRDAKD